MAHYDFTMPISEQDARKLRVQDTVTLNGTLFGIRDATQIHMFDRGRKHALRPRGPRGDPHRAERAKVETASTRPAMRRSASARPPATAWSASRGR